MKTNATTTAVAALLALALAACKDSPEVATAPDADNPEVAEADAWKDAYARFLTDYPEALSLVEETEHVKSWDAEARERWLGLRLRHVRWRRKPRYLGAQATAYVRAVDGIRAYVAVLANGEEPSPALLDPMLGHGAVMAVGLPGVIPMSAGRRFLWPFAFNRVFRCLGLVLPHRRRADRNAYDSRRFACRDTGARQR